VHDEAAVAVGRAVEKALLVGAHVVAADENAVRVWMPMRFMYFATSRDEISRSGKSTQPHAIGDTGLWALTNMRADQKRQMIVRVATALGLCRGVCARGGCVFMNRPTVWIFGVDLALRE
jgi:negative regulator of replication initiation